MIVNLILYFMIKSTRINSILSILFALFASLCYGQGHWETVPLKSVKMLTPTMIKKKLRGTAWQYMYRVKWKVQNGEILESKFVRSFPIFDSGWFYDIYIEEDKIYQYKHFFGSKESVEKSTKYSHNNEIFLTGFNDEFLYLCEEDYRNDGKQFYVAKYTPTDKKFVELLEIYYCINNTHFTILDRVSFPPIKITDTFCTAPQNPNKRAKLPFPDVKPKRHRRTMW